MAAKQKPHYMLWYYSLNGRRVTEQCFFDFNGVYEPPLQIAHIFAWWKAKQ